MRPLRCTVPGRSLRLFTAGLFLGLLGWIDSPLSSLVLRAQAPATRVFHVRETMGIRRTEYPVSVTIQMTRGALSSVDHVRLMNNSAELPAQFTARSQWDDGSVQSLDVDFNASLDPEEDKRFELQLGADVTAAAKVERGLSVREQGDTLVVGNVTFSKSGAPFIRSVSYRGEGIATGSNGLTVTDQMGRRLDLSKAQNATLDVVKPGPLLVVLKYTASIPLDATTSVPVELTVEMPNSKTWVKTTAVVSDRTRKLKDIALERPYAFSGFPVLWDFGTDTGTYGAFRAATDQITLTQLTTTAGSNSWKIESGPFNQRRALETSAGPRVRLATGWGHLQDAKSAVAFAVARFGKDPGTSTIALGGNGQLTARFQPASASTQLQLTLFEHFVATPVAIGAATNPTAMLTPPSVTVER